MTFVWEVPLCVIMSCAVLGQSIPSECCGPYIVAVGTNSNVFSHVTMIWTYHLLDDKQMRQVLSHGCLYMLIVNYSWADCTCTSRFIPFGGNIGRWQTSSILFCLVFFSLYLSTADPSALFPTVSSRYFLASPFFAGWLWKRVNKSSPRVDDLF